MSSRRRPRRQEARTEERNSALRTAFDETITDGLFVYVTKRPLESELLDEGEERCATCFVSVSDSQGMPGDFPRILRLISIFDL